MHLSCPGLSLFMALVMGCSTVHVPATAPDDAPVPGTLRGDLQTTVNKLATQIGERNCYRTNALEAAAAWIDQQFCLAGLKPRRLPVAVPAGPPYDCGAMTVWNLEAEKRGTTRANEVIVVGAHYDTKVATRSWTGRGPPLVNERGTPGADDNASGVAALLAVARALAHVSTERTIRFVAFVNEERPFYQTDAMGSVVYARLCRAMTNEFIVGMISLDTLGCYSAQPHHKRFWFSFASLIGLPAKPDYVTFLSNRYSRRFARECAEVYRVHSPVPARTSRCRRWKLVAWSDDWSFWRVGIPDFSFTDTAFLRHDHYHEISDTEEKLNYAPMADVVWGLRHVIERLANSAEIRRPSIRVARAEE
jgi:hypothetical protein